MMKKINTLWTLMLVASLLLGLSACDGEDNLSTNQYSGGVSLNVFGPSPVVRGGTLRFFGSNLDQIVQVVIPGVNAIEDIEVVKSGIPSEIRVQVPIEGPEEGYVTLVTSSGESLETETMLTYIETIEFTSFSPAEVMPGDVLTIEGEYLNLIQEVIFADNVVVSSEEFLSQDRYKITVTVPDEACTGEVILSDGDSDDQSTVSNLVYSEDELIVGTPSVTDFSSTTRFKAGETLTISGSYLHLVDYVQFNGISVPSAALAGEDEDCFIVNEGGTQITLAQPEKAASGEVSLLLCSGIEIPVASEDEFTVVTPSGLTVCSEMIKNGSSLELSGSDLDLVTGVEFASGVDCGDFTVTESSLTIQAIPTEAVDGDLILYMLNGMSVTVSYVLIKPEVTSFSENPVSAGASLTILGTDLDLVCSVSIGGGDEVVPDENSTDTELYITVPMNSGSGTVVFTLLNGTTMEVASDLSVEEAVFCYLTQLPDSDIYPNDLLSLPVANGDKLTSVEIDGASVTYILTNDVLYVSVPNNAASSMVLKLISSNGEISYTLSVISSEDTSVTVWEGSFNVGAWGALQDLSWGGYDWSTLEVGHTLTFSYTLDTSYSWWQIRVAKGNGWTALTGTDNPYELSAGSTELSITLTEAMLNELVNEGGLIVTGCYYTLTKITYK